MSTYSSECPVCQAARVLEQLHEMALGRDVPALGLTLHGTPAEYPFRCGFLAGALESLARDAGAYCRAHRGGRGRKELTTLFAQRSAERHAPLLGDDAGSEAP